MSYENIDTLLIGVRDWFVKKINNEYKEQKNNVICHVKLCLSNSTFKQLALVDSEFVGNGELLIIPNKSMHPYSRG
ncbi:MAG: hypothetical protein HQK65_22630 [Desulfamplus sp.]|nr:hypothetical protein [Desulfamplus sp.]